MKNISRRVFIKGLAVAGVAAAASTVLAGCNTNMIPGVDDGAEDKPEAPSSSNVLTFADPDDSSKTFTLTFGELVKGSEIAGDASKAYFYMDVENKMGGTVYVNKSAYTSDVDVDDYVFELSAYADGLAAATTGVVSAPTLTGLSYDEGYDREKFTLDLSKADSSVTIKVTMKRVLDTTNKIDVAVGDAKEFTYTL